MQVGDLVHWDHRTLSSPKEIWVITKVGMLPTRRVTSFLIKSSRTGNCIRANPNKLRKIETDKK